MKILARLSLLLCVSMGIAEAAPTAPNIVLIYADDLGYGDLGCYGGKAIQTPNIDQLAASGLRFTDAYATSATCTPSRYGLLTGEYPWRKKGHNILQGDATMIITVGTETLPSVLQKAGYKTGVVGKWHLGLGSPEKPANWNAEITPGPRQIGFDFSHIMAATGDRVPSVFVENERVVNLDPNDPITVSYGKKIGTALSGRENPETRKMQADDQHSDTIINGISRIGYMTGGKAALWKDEELGDHFTSVALSFIEKQKHQPFFLYFAMHEPHVPRVPAPRYVGKTGLGPRGDVIAQIDDHVGEVMAALKRLGMLDDTLVILTSDNGPVLNDGYEDDAVTQLGDHKPAGPFSGGKYSKLEGGTRVPMIVNWPGKITPGVSRAMFSQIDFFASFAALAGQAIPAGAATDSQNAIDVILGKSEDGRGVIVEEGRSDLALRRGAWKFIPPRKGADHFKTMRSGNATKPQLYHLVDDPAETKNLAGENPEKVKELAAELNKITGELPQK